MKHPQGAIQTYEEIDRLLAKAKTKPVQIHCVWRTFGTILLDQSTFDKGTVRKGSSLNNIVDQKYKAMCLNGFEVGTSKVIGPGFLFENYWFAYAYHLKLLRSEA